MLISISAVLNQASSTDTRASRVSYKVAQTRATGRMMIQSWLLGMRLVSLALKLLQNENFFKSKQTIIFKNANDHNIWVF